MIAGPRPVRRPPRTARRFLTRALLTIVGIVAGLFLYFVCQGVFAGYPRYHTELLSIIGMILIAATGGVAWIIDERRSDADG
jgi:putative copper export protein